MARADSWLADGWLWDQITIGDQPPSRTACAANPSSSSSAPPSTEDCITLLRPVPATCSYYSASHTSAVVVVVVVVAFVMFVSDASCLKSHDYDCFYASVFENEDPTLRTRPLAVQQKQIVVTCNYEARRRGLYKLQLIKDAKRLCPDVVIVLGEDLTRFRNASKELYMLLRSFSWNQKVERLGFDEVFMDVTDIVDYNLALLNPHDLSNSFFCLEKDDPTVGFAFDASRPAGCTFPEGTANTSVLVPPLDELRLRLHLGSHLAQHLREALRLQKGYTCTAGVSTNKLLSKLVGTVHKPDAQTTLLPPYGDTGDGIDNVTSLMDHFEVGKVPGIGCKITQKIRDFLQQKQLQENESSLDSSAEPQPLLVGTVRNHPSINIEALTQLLSGPGTRHDTPTRVWQFLNGCDTTEVGGARDVPRQISIEDTFGRLDTEQDVIRELKKLAQSLVRRMHTDLVASDEDPIPEDTVEPDGPSRRRWLAFPKTIRLSTSLRLPRKPNAPRSFSARSSRSAPLPGWVFSTKESVNAVADRLVTEVLLQLFRKLHPGKKGWDLSLMNVAVTNMNDAASEKGGPGRDIGDMFRTQDEVLRQWSVNDGPEAGDGDVRYGGDDDDGVGDGMRIEAGTEQRPNEPAVQDTADVDVDVWESEDEDMFDDENFRCEQCAAIMPLYARLPHERWHMAL
ncbi:DNA/RNA polymerase [Sporormia fimetaria CBS 119925]|uniref:DNA/RNA polymerase n=1 Tax=Sporormia fimetaria CBS 119925 TaxID=1340428 RepID=A0A6A6V9L4_9PLEO|nr:DNA/RNA polymerase [Sporormia fimetaria CBS 119925]